jgi:uncharacterized membrane protein
MDEQTIREGKVLAVVSYGWFLGALIAMSINSENKNAYASFHIRQSLGLCIVSALTGSLVIMLENVYITFAFWGFSFLLWLYGFIGAVQGKYHLIPFFGIFFQKYFKKI